MIDNCVQVSAGCKEAATVEFLPEIDPRALRGVAGSFATGVTVVTAAGQDGRHLGLTANSFSSVSLDPPLILWSLQKSSRLAPLFAQAEHFAVHILGKDQQAVANQFASPVEDRFVGADFRLGKGGVPLLEGCLGRLECMTWKIVDAGDHIIFIGRVTALQQCDADDSGLIFFQGKFLS